MPSIYFVCICPRSYTHCITCIYTRTCRLLARSGVVLRNGAHGEFELKVVSNGGRDAPWNETHSSETNYCILYARHAVSARRSCEQ